MLRSHLAQDPKPTTVAQEGEFTAFCPHEVCGAKFKERLISMPWVIARGLSNKPVFLVAERFRVVRVERCDPQLLGIGDSTEAGGCELSDYQFAVAEVRMED